MTFPLGLGLTKLTTARYFMPDYKTPYARQDKTWKVRRWVRGKRPLYWPLRPCTNCIPQPSFYLNPNLHSSNPWLKSFQARANETQPEWDSERKGEWKRLFVGLPFLFIQKSERASYSLTISHFFFKFKNLSTKFIEAEVDLGN